MGKVLTSAGVLRQSEATVAGDADIFQLIKDRLHVPVLCDILDALGYRRQALHPRLRPLLPDVRRCGFVGRARTLRWMETDYVVEDDPYGLEIEAMDSIKPGDVVVHSTDLGCRCAPWGELMATIARRNGAVGCVCDGGIRDCPRLIQMGFPVYYTAINPLDSKGRGRMMAFDVPIRCGEILVQPGELVCADYDGIVVVPKEVENKVLKLAQEKVAGESRARQDLLAGKTLREVYDTYHIL